MKKIVSQNLAITIVSKIFGFISFIYIAKILTESDYGSFVYITMILSLLPLLQFGSMNGTTRVIFSVWILCPWALRYLWLWK